MHRRSWKRGRLAFGLSLAILLVASACSPRTASEVVSDIQLRTAPTPRPAPAIASVGDASPPASPTPRIVRALPLRGDPDFDPSLLDPATRVWYDRLWDTIVDPENAAHATAQADRDDLYTYGRALHTHTLSVLTAFRVTGDLALLDEVDRLTEHMRQQLRDPWRGTRDGSDGRSDGYLNWVYRRGTSRAEVGKDLFEFNEMRTHGLVAEVAWAFHNNRDLASPNGIDYEQRARVWTEYLVEHFEPKWRRRNRVRRGAFPFLEHDSFHASVAFVKYHHYLGRILDSGRHSAEALRLARVLLNEVVTVPTGAGDAAVWPGRISSEGTIAYKLQGTTYARYVIGDVVDLYLDGFAPWSDPALLTALATTVREFVFVGEIDQMAFAPDIGGGKTRGGIPAPAPNTYSEFTSERYAISGLALIAPRDATGKIAAWTRAVHDERSLRSLDVHLPAAMILVHGGARNELPPVPTEDDGT